MVVFRTLWIVISLTLLDPVLPAHADFAAGQAAYDRGDFEAAHGEWLAAAEAGDQAAMFDLALLYYVGKGVEKDIHKGREWMWGTVRKDADVELSRRVIKTLLKPEYEAVSPMMSLMHLQSMYRQDDPEAIFLMGLASEFGTEQKRVRVPEDIKIDFEFAHMAYLRAARMNNPLAKMSLAVNSFYGIHVVKNQALAIKYAREAAMSMNREGQELLGNLLIEAQSPHGNNVEGLMWLYIAARLLEPEEKGAPDAVSAREQAIFSVSRQREGIMRQDHRKAKNLADAWLVENTRKP
jgi:TPR repeat protein